MSPEELQASLDDIHAWTAAGAVDGQAPAALRRPDGHVDAGRGRGPEPAEFEANQDAINGQLARGGIR